VFSSALPKIIGTRPVVAFGNERFRPVVACGLWFIPILKVPCISMEYQIDDAERSGGNWELRGGVNWRRTTRKFGA
jgi:hypothetical protein